ncbi:MAG: haloacid dehalogenase-like hydrolase [Nocardioidaceae bacterium]|nr:haloacid dehalogenase-like hydrolase [Nocardioidaceae bacterium]
MPPGTNDDRPTALFDLDGVLTHRDTMTRYVSQVLFRDWWRVPASIPGLIGIGLTRRSPALRRIPAKALVQVAMFGADRERVVARLHQVGQEFASHREWITVQAVAEARRRLSDGERVVVTTASAEPLARALLDGVGLAEAELVGSGLSSVGPFLGLGPHNYHEGKLAGLLAAGIRPPYVVVHTDSLADLPLMRASDHTVLVNPGAFAVARAEAELGDRVTVARWT